MAIQTVKTGAAVNDGTGDEARTSFTKINQNFTDNANAASRLVGTATGSVMEVGAFGLGGEISNNLRMFDAAPKRTGFFGVEQGLLFGLEMSWNSNGSAIQILAGIEDKRLRYRHNYGGLGWIDYIVYTTQNTQVDTNGFIKAASPIVSIYADKIELNSEAKLQDITFEKLGVGDYLVKGSLGFAQEGWYIEMPKDANGNVLVSVVYKQLENNDISVKTYDYMLNKKGRIVPDLETPLDIPETRWIDLRLQSLPQTNPQPFNTDKTVNTNAE